MVDSQKLARLRTIITENLRVQRDGESIDYINVGHALQDACARQNHTLFARRGCGKTLLLHHSARMLPATTRAVYLNCEDFKKHSFPNVLIEILIALFKELEGNLHGWFGKKRQSKVILQKIIDRLEQLQKAADIQDEDVRKKAAVESSSSDGGSVGIEIEKFKLSAETKEAAKESQEIERSFKVHREKLQELDRWLPELKKNIREFFCRSRREDREGRGTNSFSCKF